MFTTYATWHATLTSDQKSLVTQVSYHVSKVKVAQ